MDPVDPDLDSDPEHCPEVGEEVGEGEVGVRRLSAHLIGALGLLRLRRQRLELLQQVGLGAGLGPLVGRQRRHRLRSLEH